MYNLFGGKNKHFIARFNWAGYRYDSALFKCCKTANQRGYCGFLKFNPIPDYKPLKNLL
jgi:hypothetical protein